MSEVPDLLPVSAQMVVLRPATADGEDFASAVQYLCAEREAIAFQQEMRTGLDDPVPYGLTKKGLAASQDAACVPWPDQDQEEVSSDTGDGEASGLTTKPRTREPGSRKPATTLGPRGTR